MDSFVSQIKDAAADADDFQSFKESIRKIDEKFIKVFFAQNYDAQAPDHVFRSSTFAKPEMTIEQRRMRSPRRHSLVNTSQV